MDLFIEKKDDDKLIMSCNMKGFGKSSFERVMGFIGEHKPLVCVLHNLSKELQRSEKELLELIEASIRMKSNQFNNNTKVFGTVKYLMFGFNKFKVRRGVLTGNCIVLVRDDVVEKENIDTKSYYEFIFGCSNKTAHRICIKLPGDGTDFAITNIFYKNPATSIGRIKKDVSDLSIEQSYMEKLYDNAIFITNLHYNNDQVQHYYGHVDRFEDKVFKPKNNNNNIDESKEIGIFGIIVESRDKDISRITSKFVRLQIS